MNAPVHYEPRYVQPNDSVINGGFLFDLLWSKLPWEQREGAPRRECWFNPYGMPYTYGSGEFARTYEAHPMDPISWIVDTVNEHKQTSYDCCFVNGYEHGRQHLGWHADDSPEMDHDHPIAVLSLGAPREIWFRPKPVKGPIPTNYGPIEVTSYGDITKKLLEPGSLLTMHAGMQRGWQHRIPKASDQDCGPRISLTLRRLVR